jgi:hypothetical protein
MATPKVGDIVKDISDDVKLLVRDEIELAKSELIPSAKQAGLGAGLFGGAGYFAITAMLLLFFAAAYALVAAGLPTWAGFLIVGGALLIVAAILALIGKTRIDKVTPPERTIAAATDTLDEVKKAAQNALAAAKAPQIEGKVVDQRALR